MKLSWKVLIFMLFLLSIKLRLLVAQDIDNNHLKVMTPEERCNGIFLSYNFISRTRLFPYLKNATAQAWGFNATAKILNTGTHVLKAWEMFIGFQHKEILVSASGAVMLNADFPADVSNGTTFSGSPLTDLETSIDTAGDLTQIEAEIQLRGTQFGVKPPGIPMPKTIKLVNDGFKCPAPTRRKHLMHICCVKDPKIKNATKKVKLTPRKNGDLTIVYDVLQSYGSSYLAQVTIDNHNPLGRLDHWNLTWEWMRGEFISTMRGAYTREITIMDCIYGKAGQYYQDMDFSKVMNCEKRPTISDMPREKANDTQFGKLPYCCRNGSILPTIMDSSQARSVFQLQVNKLPPDTNRTALYPPEKWKIEGVVNPNYKCGQPLKVDPTEFPDTDGLPATNTAIASWQVVCNITKPNNGKSRCCVSFSSYYNESVIPCNTCACGCDDTTNCNPDARAMLLPPEALLIPFQNRTAKAKAWASLKHFRIPRPLPCGDNCGVSINWHVSSDYKSGWSARITLFNWQEYNFENWFAAFQLKKAGVGFENVYSFNGTLLPQLNNTILCQGLQGLNFLMGMTNGSHPKKEKVPGKQQSVISFKKSKTPGIKIAAGDGFPTKVLFNGEECSLPTHFPIANGHQFHVNMVQVVVFTILVTFLHLN